MILIIAAVIGLIGAAVYYYQQKKKKDADAVGVDDAGNIITKTTPSGEAAGLLRKLA
ncbi:hypothetical protein [Haliscomenobacter sp.]|uniref:hypothetical protein n=1 Tax=Haliscomenobacter sp. TaxID=2717303 RepID=UPI003BABCA12